MLPKGSKTKSRVSGVDSTCTWWNIALDAVTQSAQPAQIYNTIAWLTTRADIDTQTEPVWTHGYRGTHLSLTLELEQDLSSVIRLANVSIHAHEVQVNSSQISHLMSPDQVFDFLSPCMFDDTSMVLNLRCSWWRAKQSQCHEVKEHHTLKGQGSLRSPIVTCHESNSSSWETVSEATPFEGTRLYKVQYDRHRTPEPCFDCYYFPGPSLGKTIFSEWVKGKCLGLLPPWWCCEKNKSNKTTKEVGNCFCNICSTMNH